MLQQAFERGAWSRAASENQVAALEERPCVLEAQRRKKVAEVRRGDLRVAGDIHGAQEGDVDRHGRSYHRPGGRRLLRHSDGCNERASGDGAASSGWTALAAIPPPQSSPTS